MGASQQDVHQFTNGDRPVVLPGPLLQFCDRTAPANFRTGDLGPLAICDAAMPDIPVQTRKKLADQDGGLLSMPAFWRVFPDGH